MLLFPQPLLNYAWLISTLVFGLLFVLFLILYILEKIDRINTTKEFESKMVEIVEDYEHRIVSSENKITHLDDWLDMLIQKNPLISEEVKKKLLQSYQEAKEKNGGK